MIYAVTARFTDEKLRGLYQKIMDGSIYRQKPDGREIYDSMKRARITGPGIARWTELCFCKPPLDHEKKTVFNHHFEIVETVEVDAYKVFKGVPLLEHLKELNY